MNPKEQAEAIRLLQATLILLVEVKDDGDRLTARSAREVSGIAESIGEFLRTVRP